MCEKCLELVNLYYPNLSEEERGELLMSATAFPFAGPDVVEGQLKDLKANTDGSLDGAIGYASKKFLESSKKVYQGKVSEV